MAFDVLNASVVAGGEGVPVLPVLIEGIKLQPSVTTLVEQLTGDDDTTLVLSHTAGAVRIFGHVKEFDAAEIIVVDTTAAAHLVAGQAQWFALCAVKHKNAAAVSLLAVPGTVAVFALVAKPTFAEILTFLGLGAEAADIAICGDIRFYRVSDVVIDVATESIRRPWYTDDAKKTGLGIKDLADPTTLTAIPAGHMDFPLDLVTASAVTPGNLLIDGAALPKWPYGGRIDNMEYIASVAPTGASADVDFLVQLDGVVVTGTDMNLLLATAAVAAAPVVGGTASAAYSFKPGVGLDIEVDAVTNVFTAGSGVLRVHLSKYE